MKGLTMLDGQGMIERNILTGPYPAVTRSKRLPFTPTYAAMVNLWEIPGGFHISVIRKFAKGSEGKVASRTNRIQGMQLIFFQNSDDAMLFKLTWDI